MLKKNKLQIQSEIPFLMMLNCSQQRTTSVMEGTDMADDDHHMLPGVQQQATPSLSTITSKKVSHTQFNSIS